MSGRLETFSVKWKAQLVVKSGDPETISPNFWFKGQERYMRFAKNGLKMNLSLMFGWPDTFSVSVQVESAYSGRVLPELSQTKRVTQQHYICIWSETFKNVEQVDPDFVRDFQLTFRVTFEDKVSSQKPKCTNDASVQTSLGIRTNPCLESLSEDFTRLLDSDSELDVEFLCAGETTKAHKLVVCSRSPVLASMLRSDMVEGRTGVAKIEDMTHDIFQQFLLYLYSGKLAPLTFEAALSLYEAGDMYAVKSLARKCFRFLIQNLTIENACDVLVVADAHSDVEFVETVTAFIELNGVILNVTQSDWVPVFIAILLQL